MQQLLPAPAAGAATDMLVPPVQQLEQRPAESARPVPGPLEHLVSNSLAGTLRPARFFPSWSGVLTLAFTGWPPALAQLKANLNATLHALPNENPGSRWPKVSIGALRDGARLTPEQLQVLMDTCTSCSAAFTPNGSLLQSTVVVDALQVVMYQCRCLERVVVRHTIPLRSHAAIHEEPDVAEQARVAALVAEADSPGYWFHAAKDGNRETHYRGTALGVTLVHTLSLSANDAAGPLAAAIRAFRQRVDEVLPGLYTWFSDDSLHVTIRALMG